ncbi:MAG: aminopeptidase [Burkholderiales bacterium]|nr:aminopeptidase [Burkholderiales bacterium]
MERPRPRGRRAVFAAGAVLALAGCGDAAYYGQAIGGHLEVMGRARPVEAWLADPAASAPLKQRLHGAQRLREFSVQDLKLPDNPSYRRYADLQRPAAVWNVVAAPELSLELKTWCFPVLGCVSYRGYFDKAAAEALAAQLRVEGWEASVYPVPAYSTLGWSNWMGGDPLLNTFVGGTEAELARLMFHELAHQQLYVADDSLFNESFATAVERIGVERWLQAQGSAAQREQFRLAQQRRQDFRDLTQRTRRALQALYASDASAEAKRQGKAALLAQMRDDAAQLKATRWGGFAGYDAWFAQANNASLGVLGTYNDLADAFERLYRQQGGDFERFYAEAARIGELPTAQRHATLRAIE